MNKFCHCIDEQILPTNLAQLHHTGGGEVAPLAILQPPKPPLLLMYGQHQDDITPCQLQLIWPMGLVAVYYYHLVDRMRIDILQT